MTALQVLQVLEMDGGAVLRREVGQESHNAAGARGRRLWVALRRPPSSSCTCSPRKRWHQPRSRTGRCMGRRRRAPPPLSSTTHAADLPMAAVAGDAENIIKKARTVRTNWIKIQEQASGKRPLVLGPSGGWLCRLALRTGPSTLHPSRTDHMHMHMCMQHAHEMCM